MPARRTGPAFRRWRRTVALRQAVCARGHDFRVLARIRDEWDAAIAALDRDDALSPGFVLMKSIWEDYARAGLIDRD